MNGVVLKILFKHDKAFLTKEVALDFNQVPIANYPVQFKYPAFWTIRVINFIESEKRLFVDILDYQVGETQFSYEQLQLADTLNEIEKVTFRDINTTGLLRTLNDRGPLRFIPPMPERVFRREQPINAESIRREPVTEIYKEPFSVPIKDVKFIAGGVTFEKKIQKFRKSVKFEIKNDFIIEAHDAIKNYFAGVLKTKKIQVIPSITAVDGTITSIEAASEEISKLNKTLIEEVKFELVKGAGRKESVEEKNIFTMEEYLETFVGKELQPGQIFKDDKEFLETILEKSGTKHYNQLRFLSSKHQYDILKLRFVHKPFSFVFLLRGRDKFHIMWETLDTAEATYIWTVSNDVKLLKDVLKDTDKTIGEIVCDGKNRYRSRNEANFKRVFHDYKDLENGFKNWKDEIEKYLR